MRRFSAGRRLRLALLLAAASAIGLDSGTALAHALLVRSDPQPLSILQASPTDVHLWFSEDLNGPACKIIVWDRYRHVETIGHATVVPGQPRELVVAVKRLAPGAHLVLWTSASADDGHIAQGYFLFYVKQRGPAPSLVGLPSGGGSDRWPDAATLAGIVAHFFELLGAVIWVGVAAFSALIFARFARRVEEPVVTAERKRLRLVTGTSILALVLASTSLIVLQAHSFGGDWSGAFSSMTLSQVFDASYGKLWIWRQLLAIVALATLAGLADPVVAVVRRSPPGAARRLWEPGPVGPAVVGLLGIVYLYLLSASGHAASAKVWTVLGHTDLSGSVIADWLHLLGVGLWFGGQVYIVAVLAPALLIRRDLGPHAGVFLQALNRFSPVAYLSVAFFSLTGLFNTKVHIFSWYAFFHSVYGWALVVKLGLVGVMMAISVLTVFGIRPRLRRVLGQSRHVMVERGTMMMRGLLGLLRTMPVLGCAVLAATSVMFYYPVPVGLAPPGPSSYTVSVGGMTARLSVKPDHAGPNTITVMLTDKNRRPVQQAQIVVLETMLDMTMGLGKAVLTQTAPGTFSGVGDLSMGGRWQLELLVYTSGGLARAKVTVQVGT